MKPPLVPTLVAATRTVPSGFSIETFALQQVELPIVTLVIFRKTRWAAAPSNVTLAFWPGVVVVTLTAGPPGTITPPTSAGTS